MNVAHLTSFQAIEFMDWHVPKTLDISVCQTSQNTAFCNWRMVSFSSVFFRSFHVYTISLVLFNLGE